MMVVQVRYSCCRFVAVVEMDSLIVADSVPMAMGEDEKRRR